jgi:3-methyladenine DNA glycosylase AlkD
MRTPSKGAISPARPGSGRADARIVRALGARLDALATEKSRAFWERYLKGAVPFRGVPMAAIRAAVHAWWREDGPSALAVPAQKALALELFDGAFCEDKLAGTLVLQELLLGRLALQDVKRLGALFDRGRIADWNTCDWFCVKVLGNLVARDLPSRDLADAIASWRTARTLWQRRAANVAFVNLARRGEANFEGFTALMLDTCAVTVRSPERFAQTGVGWLLRELAEADRGAVLAFADEHLGVLSREAMRYAVERMPKSVQARVLRQHARARRSGGIG